MEIPLRRWGSNPLLSVADCQLNSRIERYEALRKLAAMTGDKGLRDHSRGPSQRKLLKQKAVVAPPAEPATVPMSVGSRFFDDRYWIDGDSFGEAPGASARGHTPMN